MHSTSMLTWGVLVPLVALAGIALLWWRDRPTYYAKRMRGEPEEGHYFELRVRQDRGEVRIVKWKQRRGYAWICKGPFYQEHSIDLKVRILAERRDLGDPHRDLDLESLLGALRVEEGVASRINEHIWQELTDEIRSQFARGLQRRN